MKSIRIELPYNFIGALASGLCLLHCLITPFLFAVQTRIFVLEESNLQWWGLLDIFFLVISLLAVWWSAKNTSKSWLRIALWISWSFLALVVLNEKLSLYPLLEEAIYVPSIALVFFHLYNRKYCQYEDETCCLHGKNDTGSP